MAYQKAVAADHLLLALTDIVALPSTQQGLERRRVPSFVLGQHPITSHAILLGQRWKKLKVITPRDSLCLLLVSTCLE